MPKRILDDSLLNSPSMAVLSPRAQDAFPRFILLADDFGCFEAHPRSLAAKGWPDRTDVSETDIASWLDEYASRAVPGEPPMAMLWEERGRRWCFLTGWNGTHGQRKRVEYDPKKAGGEKGSKRRTPPPPADLLAAVMAGQRRAADGKPPGTDLLSAAGNPNFPGGNPTFPGGNARETGETKSSDSGPGRGNQISRPGDSRLPPFPAAAVPDAVADAVAAVTVAAALPAEAPRPETVWPLGERFRALVGQGLGGQQNGGKGLAPLDKAEERDELEAWIAKAGGPERAAAACLEKARRSGKGPRLTSLSYFRGMVHDLIEHATPVAAAIGDARVQERSPWERHVTPKIHRAGDPQ